MSISAHAEKHIMKYIYDHETFSVNQIADYLIDHLGMRSPSASEISSFLKGLNNVEISNPRTETRVYNIYRRVKS